MLYRTFLALSTAASALLSAQSNTGTTDTLDDVVITFYPQSTTKLNTPASISVISEDLLQKQAPYSLVPAFNTVAGIRMEERSPGSYRLSIRGSLLRSPFGIRNVKIYLDEFPLTDAGGNTYLNLWDPAAIKNVEILKGPDGSSYGANTGGVVRLSVASAKKMLTAGAASLALGSYGLLKQHATYEQNTERQSWQLFQGVQRSDGYRRNSALSRYSLLATYTKYYIPQAQLKLMMLYSDLRYATPGGLTSAQMALDPQMARVGAQTQRIGISNRYSYLGLAHDTRLSATLSHTWLVFGSISDFKNPFLSNYESRDEKSMGMRTFFKWSPGEGTSMRWHLYAGLEWQRTASLISNHGNKLGVKDTLQASDVVSAQQHFYFTRFVANPHAKLTLEAALSLNFYRYTYKSQYPVPELQAHVRTFDAALMPKLSASYQIATPIALRASVSRGFSPPTLAEVRPSDNLFYTNLGAESGWNYEVGLRAASSNKRLFADVALFYFKLDHAIVRKLNSIGQEYFVNAGLTSQPGLEVQMHYKILQRETYQLLHRIEFYSSFTGYRFTFKEYASGGSNYSGNALTGIPKHTIVSGITADFRKFQLFVQHTFTGKIPLDDANTVYAPEYHLLQAKASYALEIQDYKASLFLGVDNILNSTYSLGNDINAFGGRYFNPAPVRNVYGGLSLQF